MYIIFDTETTGLENVHAADAIDRWPRLVQLAWRLYTYEGELISECNAIVKPEGFEIPYNAEKIHGISTERAIAEGLTLEEVLKRFDKDISQTTFIVGHNIEFDISVVKSEYERQNMPISWEKKKVIDTMKKSTDYYTERIKSVKKKWPKLGDLFQLLFGFNFEHAHSADIDVMATTACLFSLIKKKIITVDLPSVALFQNKSVSDLLQNQALNQLLEDIKKCSLHSDQDKAKENINKEFHVSHGLKNMNYAYKEFIHLHCHSDHTQLKSTLKVNNLIDASVSHGMKGVALTDMGHLKGAFEFHIKAQKKGIKPIIGMEAYVVPDHHNKVSSRGHKDLVWQVVFLSKNMEGYKNLCELSCIGFSEGFYYVPRIGLDIIQQYSKDLICLTGNIQGHLAHQYLNYGENKALKALKFWHDIFGEDLYLELCDHELNAEKKFNEWLYKISKSENIKLVATNDVYMKTPDELEVNDILRCINGQHSLEKIKGEDRSKYGLLPNDSYYFCSPLEMGKKFSHCPETLLNTRELYEKVDAYSLQRDIELPSFKVDNEGVDQDKYLKEIVIKGAEDRYEVLDDTIQQRLNYELEVICKMGFAGYFLIVQDIVQSAQAMGVRVGVGRGSAIASIVSYCLGITNLDPLKYDLVFERFLNPERVNMPDIDIDFDDDGRDKVIEHIVNKYGKDNVAHIITFNKIGARSAIRDVGRVMNYPLNIVEKIVKYLPYAPFITLKKVFEEVPELSKWYNDSKHEYYNILRNAKKIEGFIRSSGVHPAGVIISPYSLSSHIPICVAKESQLMVTQYEGNYVESVGMLKVDILALRNLSIMNSTIDYIKQNYNVTLDLEQIPLDDKKTFALYSRGDTYGTFQFESEGMRKYLIDLQPTTFQDLIAMNALYRPGPIEFIPNYIRRKHGTEKIEHIPPQIEDILKPTYGIMIYQEQIMRVAQILAGYTLAEADLLRRAMGKKDKKEMSKHEKRFKDGCKESGLKSQEASSIFQRMEKFAEYGFNQAHATGYAYVAYQTAYCKAHYTTEYMAALLSHHMDNHKKIGHLINESRRMDINVLLPDINHSERHFLPLKNKTIRYGFSSIKGIGEALANAIIKIRKEKGNFKDIFDFIQKMDKKYCTRKTIECLIYSGSFDKLHTDRKQLVDKIDLLVQHSNKTSDKHQKSLFSNNDDVLVDKKPALTESLSNKTDNTIKQDNEILEKEKEVLGFYVNKHPLDIYDIIINLHKTHTLAELNTIDLKKDDSISVNVVGIISNININREKANPIARFDLEDNTSTSIKVITYRQVDNIPSNGSIVMVQGNLKMRKDGNIIYATNVDSIEYYKRRNEHNLKVHIILDGSKTSEKDIGMWSQILQKYPGNAPLYISVISSNGLNNSQINFKCGNEWNLGVNTALQNTIKECFPNIEMKVEKKIFILKI